jgi:hypothetical protein
MTGPRDALAGRVIPPAGFAARTSVARYARTAPSTTSGYLPRALSNPSDLTAGTPRIHVYALVSALSRPKHGSNPCVQ